MPENRNKISEYLTLFPCDEPLLSGRGGQQRGDSAGQLAGGGAGRLLPRLPHHGRQGDPLQPHPVPALGGAQEEVDRGDRETASTLVSTETELHLFVIAYSWMVKVGSIFF